jgi:hypothetical protein
MEHILRQGELGLKQDFLIYGKEYKLWCKGKYLGIGTYTDDPNIGDLFLGNGKTSEGEDCFVVYIPDEWQFV